MRTLTTSTQPGPENALAGDEGRSSCCAALLPVRVGEPHSLVGDPVDVRRTVPPQSIAVAAQVGDPDVVPQITKMFGFESGIGFSPFVGCELLPGQT